MRIFFRIVIFITFIQPVLSQELPLNSQIFINPYYYNPAFAGFEDRPALYVYRRQQWTAIEGAPVTSGVNFHTIFNDKINFGVHIQNDKRSILSTTSLLITGGYRASFSENHYVSLALSGGIGFNNINLDGVDTDDPAIIEALDKNMYLDGNAGFLYHNEGFNLSFSLPKLFKNKLLSSEAFKVGEISPLNDMIFMTSYKWEVSEGQFAIEPYLNYFFNKDLAGQFEIIGRAILGDVFWIGASYRQQYGISGFLGLNIHDNFKFGYAYDFFDAKPARFNNNTHDIQLALIFGEKKRSRKSSVSMISKRRSMLQSMGRLPSQQNQNMYKPKPEPKPAPPVETETYKEDEALQELLDEMNMEETSNAQQENKPKTDSLFYGENSDLQDLLDEMAQEETAKTKTEKAPKIHENPTSKPTPKPVVVAAPVIKEEPIEEDKSLQELLDEMAEEEAAPPPPVVEETKIEEKVISTPEPEPVSEQTIEELLEELGMNETPAVEAAAIVETTKPEPITEEPVDIFNFEFDDDLVVEKEQPKELTAEEALVSEINGDMKEETIKAEQEALEKLAEAEKYIEPTLDDEGIYIGPTVVTKGDHLLELEKGSYVVVGTFNSYREAEEYSDKLFIEGYYTKFGYISQTKIYYVYIFKSDDNQEASDTSDRFKEIGAKFRENWVLQVQ